MGRRLCWTAPDRLEYYRLEGLRKFMCGTRRRLTITATLFTLLFVSAEGGRAQETSTTQEPAPSEVVGPPQLREFRLPGTQSTPPQEATQPQLSAPPAEEAVPAPSTSEPAAPPSPPSPTRAPPVVVAPPLGSERPAPRPDEAAPAEPRQFPARPTETTQTTSVTPLGQDVPVEAQSPEQIEQPSTSDESSPWPYIIGGLLLAATAFFGIRTLLKRAQPEQYEEWVPEQLAEPADPAVPVIQERAPPPARPIPPGQPRVDVPPARPAPTPVVARDPAPRPQAPAAPALAAAQTAAPAPRAPGLVTGGVVGVQIRPWLKLDFRPDRAAATLTEAAVQYELLIQNEGNAAARNVRIEARMFNAGVNQDQEINAFFARPIDEQKIARVPGIAPRTAARVRDVVVMPKNEVREITIEGRRLFIPMVAINVIYDWGDGKSGQTSMSYLVGRKTEVPSTKMGAFRMDLGPRIYRSIGQKPSNVAVLV